MDKNGVVNRSGVFNEYCVLSKNDALDNDVEQNAVTPSQPTHRTQFVLALKMLALGTNAACS